MDSNELKKLPLKCLRDDGLLFEINRLVMHPIGRALVLEEDDNGELSAHVVETDDMEGFLFAPETFTEGKRKAHEYMLREGLARVADREAVLRFLVQQKAEDGDEDDVR